MHHRMRKIAALAVCSILTAGLTASSAAAGSVDTVGSVRYVRQGFHTTEGQPYLTVRAMCPRGTHVTGGGVSNGADFGELTIVHTYPVDGRDRGSAPDDGWAVLLNNRDEGRHGGRAHAICTEHPVRYRTESFQIASGAQDQFDVPCPQDTFVLSGGTRGPRQVVENSVFPNDNTEWGAYLENHSGAEKTFTETVVCSEIVTTVEQSNNDPVDPLSRAMRSVTCPDTLVVYGGGQSNSAGFGGLFAAAMFPAGAGHGTWRVNLDNFSDTLTFSAAVYAVCGPSD